MRFADEVLAWDFGDSQRAPFSGFSRIGPQDAHLQGRPTATTRSGSFAPFNDGLRGVNQIKIPFPQANISYGCGIAIPASGNYFPIHWSGVYASTAKPFGSST
ncbi:hypothetical protein PCI56_02950 [Plesiomonas shigelloides subsp. oncorhynchi]|nr:hypothetical protein [Plesiomonas shigelloides]